MVSTHLKNISQIGILPQVRVKIKNVWNHQLENHQILLRGDTSSFVVVFSIVMLLCWGAVEKLTSASDLGNLDKQIFMVLCFKTLVPFPEDPWDWNIYLYDMVDLYGINVGKYTIHGSYCMGLLKVTFLKESLGCNSHIETHKRANFGSKGRY